MTAKMMVELQSAAALDNLIDVLIEHRYER